MCGPNTLIRYCIDMILVVLALLLSVTSLGLGFHFGSRRANAVPQAPRTDKRQAVEIDKQDDEDEDEEASDGDLALVQAGFMEQCKIVRIF